jgi:hypothetical protein
VPHFRGRLEALSEWWYGWAQCALDSKNDPRKILDSKRARERSAVPHPREILKIEHDRLWKGHERNIALEKWGRKLSSKYCAISNLASNPITNPYAKVLRCANDCTAAWNGMGPGLANEKKRDKSREVRQNRQKEFPDS